MPRIVTRSRNGHRWPVRAGLVGLVGLLVAALAATACSAAPAPSAPGQGRDADTLVIAMIYEPENLNPIFKEYFFSEGNLNKVFNGLLRYDRDLRQVPDLAAELPQRSPDGLTVTVRVRQDVRFHDGQPLTAEDVAFTFNSILDPAVGSGFRSHLDSVRSVEVVDRYTVRFALNRVDPGLEDKLHMGILPRHLLAGTDLNTAGFNAAPVGTGAYVFREWRKGERLVLEANPDYFAGPAKIRRIVYVFVEDENARLALMENGAADMAPVFPRLATRLRDDAALRVLDVRSAENRLVVLPNNNPVLADPQVRQALSLAVNRERMVRSILVGTGRPAVDLVVPGHWTAGADTPSGYDADAARRLLDQAGWRDSDGDGIRERGGQRLGFTLMYDPQDTSRKDLALATGQDLREVGVEVTPAGVGWEVIYSRLDQDAVVYSTGILYDPDPVAYRMFHSSFATDDDPATNPAKMVNPAVDAALDAGRSSLDPARRAEAYRTLWREVRQDGSYVGLVWLDHVTAVSTRVTGMDPQVESGHGIGRGILWNLQDWGLTPRG